jgi:tetratricopeptide (TPR) repeat protein
MALRYKKEIENITTLPEDRDLQKKRKKNHALEDVVKYQSGNEVIIQPLNEREKGASPIIFAFATGICIGLALVFFLILPAQISSAKQEANNEVKVIGETLAMKTSEIAELQQQVESLQTENTSLEEELGNYIGTDGKLRANDQILLAAIEYMTDSSNYLETADYLDQVDSSFLETEASEAFILLYEQLVLFVGADASDEYYSQGNRAYENEDYETAITYFAKAYKFNDKNADALFNLGNAYDMNGNTERATEIYKEVVEKFSEYRVASKAQDYLDSLE